MLKNVMKLLFFCRRVYYFESDIIKLKIFSDTTIQRFNVTMILRNETVGHSFKYVLQRF